MTIKRILCPTDFSSLSQHALEHAVALAQWYGARITVLHVDALIALPAAPMGFSAAFTSLHPDREALTTELSRFTMPLAAGIVPVQTLIAEGPPAHVICEKAVELRADLIVLGTHGRGGLEHLALGSVAETVLRKAPCPTLIVPPAVEHAARPIQFRRVLCPIDFGPSTTAALRAAASLAREAGARFTVLHVLEPLDHESLVVPVPFSVPEYHRLREQQALEQLDRCLVAEGALADAVQMTTRGKPSTQIVRVAQEMRADLILMGIGGGGALRRILLGSTTHAVVREAHCPVLTIRATEAMPDFDTLDVIHAAAR